MHSSELLRNKKKHAYKKQIKEILHKLRHILTKYVFYDTMMF